MRRRTYLASVLLLASACGTNAPEGDPSSLTERIRESMAGIDGARIANANGQPGNWMAHGRDYGEQRFSPLDQVNEQNIDELGLSWFYDTGGRRGHEATPIVIDGIMILTSPWSVVHALDAGTGEPLWTHDPEVPREWGRWACCDVVNRGAAVWKGKVYVGALDGRLIALDASTGEMVWEVQTTDPDRRYTITGAPRVVKDKVIIGNGGAEFGVRGYITAYDAATGDQVWRFYTVPGNPAEPFEHPELEAAAETWSGEWWTVGGGGTAWDSMAYDPELDLLYVGTGNGSPWTRYHRSPGGGDNLYLCSILALRPDTGQLVWYYQTTPGDNWDYTSVQHILLADLNIGGESRKVLLQAPKNGFFYVLDRETGELLSAEEYVTVTWASHVDLETGRPVETPESNYDQTPQVISPNPDGGHNWHPMSFSPRTGLVYIPAIERSLRYILDRDFQYDPRTINLGLDLVTGARIDETSPVPVGRGHLKAWDPVTQKEVWRVEHEGYLNGGVLSTAGNLVFQGTSDGRLVAYSAESGQMLWETRINVGIIAPPVTYTVDGEQYVAVVAGLGGAALGFGDPDTSASSHYDNVGRVLAFKLGGATPIPDVTAKSQKVPEPPPLAASAETVARGYDLYHSRCIGCHGSPANGMRIVLDLAYMSAQAHDSFSDIVTAGLFLDAGMPDFGDLLTADDAEAIHAYIIQRAREEWEAETGSDDR